MSTYRKLLLLAVLLPVGFFCSASQAQETKSAISYSPPKYLFALTPEPLPARPDFLPLQPLVSQMAQPAKPIDSRVVAVIRKAYRSSKRKIQFTTVEGSTIVGLLMYVGKESANVMPDDSTSTRTFRYADIVSARIPHPTTKETLKNGAVISGIVLAYIVALPLFFIWGLSCDFRCS